MIDAGADAVIGHGPHVLRGIEFYRGRLIAYSLGNFATYRGFNLSGPARHHRRAAAGVLGIDRTLQRGAPGADDAASPGGPRTRSGPRGVHLVRQLSAEDFGATAAVISETGRDPPAAIACLRLPYRSRPAY